MSLVQAGFKSMDRRRRYKAWAHAKQACGLNLAYCQQKAGKGLGIWGGGGEDREAAE